MKTFDPKTENKALYQEIYDTVGFYGNHDEGRCPGARLIPRYKEYIVGRFLDVGCGRGHAVRELRNLGLAGDGVDIVSVDPDMLVADCTTDLDLFSDYDTCICIDVIEHLDDEMVEVLFGNMKKTAVQIFSIHNGDSFHEGLQLHINKKPFEQWDEIVEQNFSLTKGIQIHETQKLYICSFH